MENVLKVVVEAESKPGAGGPSSTPPAPQAPAAGSAADLRRNDALDEAFGIAPPTPAGPAPGSTRYSAFGGQFDPNAISRPKPAPTFPNQNPQYTPGSVPFSAFGADYTPTAPQRAIPIATPVAKPTNSFGNLIRGQGPGGLDSLRGLLQVSQANTSTAYGIASGASALASTGILGSGAAAAAAGPIGLIAVAAAKGVDLIIGKAADSLAKTRQGIESIPAKASDVLNDRPLQLFNRHIEETANALGEIPIVGKLFAEQVRLAAAPIKAFAETLSVVAERGKELGGLNAKIATAAANQDVASLQADIREANRLGGNYAKVIELQSGFDNEFRNVMLPIKELISEVVIDIGKPALSILKEIAPLLNSGTKAVGSIYEGIKGAAPYIAGIHPLLFILYNVVRNISEKKDKEAEKKQNEEAEGAMKMLLDLAGRKFSPGPGQNFELRPAEELMKAQFNNLHLPDFANPFPG